MDSNRTSYPPSAPKPKKSILIVDIIPVIYSQALACLIFSTSARLGRIFDRVNTLKTELETVLGGKSSFTDERIAFLRDQFQLQRIRAGLIQKAMAALYTATALFVAASLAIAFNVAYGTANTAWIPTAIALLGGVFLFVSSAILLYESRFNLRFVNRHLDFIQFLQDQHEKKGDGH